MTLSERCNYFWSIFNDLQDTNSILEKRYIVSKIPEWLTEDFQYIIECLNGKHKFGYTYNVSPVIPEDGQRLVNPNTSVKSVLEWLQEPRIRGDLRETNIAWYCNQTAHLYWFFEPIVNRTLKLGIGNSILPKDGLAPMLAKKYEGKITYDKYGYYITEKLDGNRCIASYEDGNWIFRSRNGKLMHVDFDMSDLPKEFVYDGEVMSVSQTTSSMKLGPNLLYGTSDFLVYKDEFNRTSGLINRHNGKKELVYNIFDIMLDEIPYHERREELDRIAYSIEQGHRLSPDVRIVPILGKTDYNGLNNMTSDYLAKVCNMGGEGLMINLGSGLYNHKRTDQLLKLKQVQSIDMIVTGIQEGSGKYEYMVGAINCMIDTDDGKHIEVSVGSGLSDEQRADWYLHPEKIIGKIVEIQYFSTSQDGKNKGSNNYSLRFPRLKTVRIDKSTTSQY